MKISSRNIFTFQLNLMDPLFGVRKLTFAKQFAFFLGKLISPILGSVRSLTPSPTPMSWLRRCLLLSTQVDEGHMFPLTWVLQTSWHPTEKPPNSPRKKNLRKQQIAMRTPPPCSNVLFWADKMSWDSWPKNDRHHAARLLLKRSGGAIHWNISTKKTEVVITSWRLFWWLMVLVRYKFDKNRG